jgi:hypothetical protein
MFIDLVKHDQLFLHLVFFCFVMAFVLMMWQTMCPKTVCKDEDSEAVNLARLSFFSLAAIFTGLFVLAFLLENKYFERLY